MWISRPTPKPEDRATVLAVVDALCDSIGDLGIHEPGAWLPGDDPHRRTP